MYSHTPTPLLLSVIGGSPQILTETLYGIYQSKQAIPEKIQIITTSHGLNKLHEMDMFGKNGKVNQFTKEYDLASISFEATDVHVLRDNDGQALDDARSSVEHTSMADAITELVRTLTNEQILVAEPSYKELSELDFARGHEQQQEMLERLFIKHNQLSPSFAKIVISNNRYKVYYDKYSIHASIAGGRKSMTFLLGYAMSLFARRHDKLSHVLVDQRVENSPLFFYPSKNSLVEEVGFGKKETLDFQQMHVELAEIPMMRVRENMPELVLSVSRSYSDTVRIYEELQAEPKLSLYLKMNLQNGAKNKPTFTIQCGSQNVTLDIKNMTFLLACTRFDDLIPSGDIDDDPRFAVCMMSCYATLLEQKDIIFNNHEEAFIWFDKTENMLADETLFVGKGTPFDEHMHFFKKDGKVKLVILGGIAKCESISKYITDLKRALSKQIGNEFADLYLPKVFAKNKGNKETTKAGGYKYKLDIKEENIFEF